MKGLHNCTFIFNKGVQLYTKQLSTSRTKTNIEKNTDNIKLLLPQSCKILACYYLTYYKWAEGEAVHTAEGLGAYLGKKYGHESIFSSFTADHWNYVQTWKWNVRKKKFDTLQEMNLAENVIYDPTATIMKAMQDENNKLLQDNNNGTEDTPQLETPEVTPSNEDNDNALNNSPSRNEGPAPYVYDETTADLAQEIAQSIQSESSMSTSSISANSPSLSQLAA